MGSRGRESDAAPPLTRGASKRKAEAETGPEASGPRKSARTDTTSGPGSAAAPTEGAPTDEPASGGEKPPGKMKPAKKKSKGKKPAPRGAIVLEGDWTVSPPLVPRVGLLTS